MSVVQESPGRAYFGRVLAVVAPEWAEDDGEVDFDESLARQDDVYWAWAALRARFTWQLFLNWWVARRYVAPRDVRRR